MMEAQVKTAVVAMTCCLMAAAIGMVIGEKAAWVAVGLTTGLVLGWLIKLKFGGFLGLFAASMLILAINDEYHIGAVATGTAAILSAAFMLFARMQYTRLRSAPCSTNQKPPC